VHPARVEKVSPDRRVSHPWRPKQKMAPQANSCLHLPAQMTPAAAEWLSPFRPVEAKRNIPS
jgi:hypothetical protein